MTSSDCATSPLSQEDGDYNEWIQQIKYDHMGITHSCMPTFFFPGYRTSSGGGPYSVFRRCVYGKEVIEYTIDYAKQFLTAYHDVPKFLSMEYLEAHERT